MKLSVNWLRELVDFPAGVEELAERLTTLGLEVEAIEPVRLLFPGVSVGHVLQVHKHPNADRLRVCRVQTSEGEVSVVCGAPNVRDGLHVALALPGAVLPGDFKIKKSKIRGEVSMGMICSERELGLGQSHEGILELDGAPAVGTPVDDLFGYEDHCIEIEVTPNRPDWLSHIGVARELAAYYRTELRMPDAGDPLTFTDEDGGWRARIEDSVGCRRFTGRLIDGSSVTTSPLWMRQRLIAIGQRPINSIVDASNYVLHECGQPNHVFDRAKIQGETIILRRAKAGESFTTLDETERELNDGHLLVADAGGGLALAGIMGGANSEVDETSTRFLLEVAQFDPGTVRRGRRAVAMSTDASYRFERGIDRGMMEWATRRLTKLVIETSCGTASPRAFATDGDPLPAPAQFVVRASQVRRVVGVELSAEEMADHLTRLGIGAEANGDAVSATQPSFRHDLLEEVDAVEEIARLHGYDRLELPQRAPMLRPAQRTEDENLRRRLREMLSARGYAEVVATSFMRDGDLDRLQLAADDPRRSTMAVLNPVVKEEAQLRSTALAEMLRIVDRNRRHGHVGPIRLFQVDRCFQRIEGEDLARETETLTLIWNGAAHATHFGSDGGDVGPFDVLGEVDTVLRSLGIAARPRPGEVEPYHRTGSGATLEMPSGSLGRVGEIDPAVLAGFDLTGTTFVAEIELARLVAALPRDRRFAAYSSFPPVRRDLSLVVPRAVAYGAVVDRMEALLTPLLESHEVFDLYEGEGLPAGTRAVGVRLSLRSPSGTLKDSKVDGLLSKLLDDLGERYEIRLR